MSNLLTSEWRGCAASFPQPADNEAVLRAQEMLTSIYLANCDAHFTNQPLDDIVYRSSDGERDITHRVFRWDRRAYQQIFQNGFEAWPQEDTPDETYYSLEHHVRHGGAPVSLDREETHAFVSTTIRGSWRPNLRFNQESEILIYRYEIYAPGGIWVNETLGDRYDDNLRSQAEVSFVSGIAPRYIRSAQLFRARRPEAGLRFAPPSRADNVIILNGHFNPHPTRRIRIRRPLIEYTENDTRRLFNIRIYSPADHRRVKREAFEDAIDGDWYVKKVADSITNSVSAVFRSSNKNEAYFFVENEYVLLNYAPGTTDDEVVNGPLLISEGFPSLAGTVFGEEGIDCAFDTENGNEAFIFSGNLCAYIDYAPGTTDDKILKGPMAITAMFPFFKHTVFQNGIDSAFRAKDRAYLFKGNQYALINYSSNDVDDNVDIRVIAEGFGGSENITYTSGNVAANQYALVNDIDIRTITEGFRGLENTIFASGIDAAFASHGENEAYIFKKDKYALFNFTDGCIIGDVKAVLPNWPSLRCILPLKNREFDSHNHDEQHEQTHPIHDEL